MDDQARPVQVGLTQLSLFLTSLFLYSFYLSTYPFHIIRPSHFISEHLLSRPFFFPLFFFPSSNQDHLPRRMRESNFAFPAQNRAAVCISSQLYDRRGALFALCFLSLIG